MRTDRRDRRLRGKSDTIDAENAARAVLAGLATAVPKSADGAVEMIRQIKVAKDVAVKARTSAMISLKQVLVNAPDELRQELQPLTKMALIPSLRGAPAWQGDDDHRVDEAHAALDRSTLGNGGHRDLPAPKHRRQR